MNDSARAVMAAASKFRDDIGGSIATAGTSTAYTLTSYQVFTALQAGLFIAFNPHTTNGASPTLNADGLGAKPLRSAPNTEFPSGVLVQGTPYTASYFTSNGGEWIVNSIISNPYVIPIGGLIPYTGTTAPSSSFVLPAGQAISRTTYATYFNLVGTTWGTGDGSTTFNVIDLRGRAIFGLDNMGGSAASRITVAGGNWDATVLEATARGAQNQTLTSAQMPSHTHTGTTAAASADHTHTVPIVNSQTFAAGSTAIGKINGAADVTTATSGSTSHTHTFTSAATGGDGSHPIMPPALVLPYILRII